MDGQKQIFIAIDFTCPLATKDSQANCQTVNGIFAALSDQCL